jgi:hypothetical protein
MKTVNEKDLYAVLKKIRDLRAYAVRTHRDPWATRQALLFAIAMDTAAALERGVSGEDLRAFDALAMGYAHEFVQEMRRTEAETLD